MKRKPIKVVPNEYQTVEEQQKDVKIVMDSTEQLIDSTFMEVCQFLEGKNIGELKAFRTLLQTHLDKVDLYGKNLVELKVIEFNKDQRVKVGSIFSIAAKIQDRIGYIDYRLDQLKLTK